MHSTRAPGTRDPGGRMMGTMSNSTADLERVHTCRIVDGTGRIIHVSTLTSDHSFNAEDWAPGIYLLMLTDHQTTISYRIVRE